MDRIDESRSAAVHDAALYAHGGAGGLHGSPSLQGGEGGSDWPWVLGLSLLINSGRGWFVVFSSRKKQKFPPSSFLLPVDG